MLEPGFYPEKPARVELMQTQMSFVFLAGEFVYKVKKPVNLGYLDYTTLEKRRYFCEREVALNRRLCPDIYLGVLPVTDDGEKVGMGGGAADHGVVDYAVKMRYLPQDRMMNVLLGHNAVSDEMIAGVASRLSVFHREAETSAAIGEFGRVESVRANTDENFNQTERSLGRTISQAKYDRIRDYTRRFLDDRGALFRQRMAEGRIRDCHGDLHAAHVCFYNGIWIYDCIEFNDRFRYGDIASEVAFLAMDLDHYGRADLSHAFLRSYRELSGDGGLAAMLPFYRCYRAYVRGKVEGFKLDDAYMTPKDKDHAEAAARGYFDLASFYTRPRPALCITVGVTGTGKTHLSRALARRTGAAVISSDVVRKQLAGIPVTEHRYDQFNAGLYSADFTRRTYDTMLDQARGLLESGVPVILDASFIRSADRRTALALAAGTGAESFIVECNLDDAALAERLSRRTRGQSVSDGRLEILGPQKSLFEPVTEVDGRHHTVVDTSRSTEANIRQIQDMMGET